MAFRTNKTSHAPRLPVNICHEWSMLSAMSPSNRRASRLLGALALCSFAALSCRRASAPGTQGAMATLDGTLNEVFTQLAARARVPVVIDPTAHALAACARMRVTLPEGLAPTQLADLAGASVRGLGMLLSASSSAWVLSQPGPMRGPYPRECFGRAGSAYMPPSGALGSSSADPSSLLPAMPMPPPPPPSLVPPMPGGYGLAAPDAGALGATLAAGIRQRSDTDFEVTHAARDAIFESATNLSTQSRIVPAMTAGVVTGIRMFGVRRGSAFSLLGFQNGDELQRIDGLEISSPDRALEVYSRVRTASTCTVQIVRRGLPTELHYRLVP